MTDFQRNSVTIAKAGIYDLRLHHDAVIMPVLKYWKVFDRNDFGPEGEQARDELVAFLASWTRRPPGSSSSARSCGTGRRPAPRSEHTVQISPSAASRSMASSVLCWPRSSAASARARVRNDSSCRTADRPDLIASRSGTTLTPTPAAATRPALMC